MNPKLLIDMNLSVDWVAALGEHGFDAIHWRSVGEPTATDREIMAWAREHQRVVITHDLDFGTLLALTHAIGPSVLLLRGSKVLPQDVMPAVLSTLVSHGKALRTGALVVVDAGRRRVRWLPI